MTATELTPVADLRYFVIALAAAKMGYKVSIRTTHSRSQRPKTIYRLCYPPRGTALRASCLFSIPPNVNSYSAHPRLKSITFWTSFPCDMLSLEALMSGWLKSLSHTIHTKRASRKLRVTRLLSYTLRDLPVYRSPSHFVTEDLRPQMHIT